MRAQFKRPDRRLAGTGGHSALGRAVVETLEDRQLLANPVIDAPDSIYTTPRTGGLPAILSSIPLGKSVIIPITGSDGDDDRITYSVSSNNPNLVPTIRKNNPYLKVSVANFGDMIFELFSDTAPKTTAAIAGLAQSGFYENVIFHRVLKDFVIQGGDPTGTGSSGPPRGGTQAEQDAYEYDDEYHSTAVYTGFGQLAMAKTIDDSNGSQFFVTASQPRHLDFQHSMFGQLVRGFSVLNAIRNVQVSGSTPTTPVKITSATIIENHTDAVIDIKSTGSAATTGTITITATDEDGNTTQRQINVGAANDITGAQTPNNAKPFLGPVPDRVAAAGATVTIPLTHTHIDGGSIVYGVKSVPAGTNISFEGNNMIVNPADDFTGVMTLTVGVRDGTREITFANSANTQIDFDATFDAQTFTIAFGDQALTGGTGLNVTATADQQGTFNVARFTDPDASSDADDFTAIIKWGDGKVKLDATITEGPDGTFTVSGMNTYDADGLYRVEVEIIADAGARLTTSSQAVVGNLAANGVSNSITGLENVQLSGTELATFTVDPRRLLGNLRARIAWGDGSITDGILKSEGANNVFSVVGSHTYADPFSGTATVTLLDNGGTVATVNATVSIAENDDPVPTVVLSGDSSGIRGQTRRVRITTSDRAADLAANFIYQVDWGDGVKQTIVGSAVKDLTHVYNVAGNFTVKVKATDQNGQTGPVSQTTISILAAEVQNDPCEPGKKSLFIGGTLNGDQIRLTTDKKGRINVRFGNKSVGVFPATRRIVVFGRNGSDSIQVDKRITRMVEIYGEGGNDLIAGGGGNDIIVGGAGKDQVSAGLGRDIVIGGVDSDSMLGGDGDDILIANGSTHETNRAALCAIQKEWVRNDQTYTQRINHIRGTKGGGLNGSFRFNDDSLLGPDNTLDILTGNAGTDAFFMNTDLGVKDRASDRVNSEAVGDVD